MPAARVSSELSGGIGVPSLAFPLMALFLYERSTPPPAVPTPVALPVMIDLSMRTIELAPCETTPVPRLLLTALLT